MKKVLLHFEVGGLYPRAAHLLAEVKRSRPNIKWGIQTSNMAIACCYVAAREREKDVKLVDMAVSSVSLAFPSTSCLGLSFFRLSRPPASSLFPPRLSSSEDYEMRGEDMN